MFLLYGIWCVVVYSVFCGDTKQWLMAAKGLSYLWLCGEMLVVIGYCSHMLSCTWAVGAQPCAWKDNCYYTELLNCEVSFFCYCPSTAMPPVSSPPTDHGTGLPCPACHCTKSAPRLSPPLGDKETRATRLWAHIQPVDSDLSEGSGEDQSDNPSDNSGSHSDDSGSHSDNSGSHSDDSGSHSDDSGSTARQLTRRRTLDRLGILPTTSPHHP